jgi:hypothetical protein
MCRNPSKSGENQSDSKYENLDHCDDTRRPHLRVGTCIRTGLRQGLQQMLQVLRDLCEMQKERLQNLL